MTLYLMRHAEAVDFSSEGVTRDADRRLTDKGRRQAKRMGILLKRLDVHIDRVVCSPFARARETSELVLRAMGLDLKPRLLDELKPNGSASAMWDAISPAKGEKVLAIGHLPSIASFAGALLGSLSNEPLWFHKSTLAALKCEMQDGRKPRVRLEWMASPAMAKRLSSRHASKDAAGLD